MESIVHAEFMRLETELRKDLARFETELIHEKNLREMELRREIIRLEAKLNDTTPRFRRRILPEGMKPSDFMIPVLGGLVCDIRQNMAFFITDRTI